MKENEKPTPLMDEKQAAAYMGFKNPGSIRNMRSRGEGPKYVKLGKIVRYRLEDLNLWIEQQLKDPAA